MANDPFRFLFWQFSANYGAAVYGLPQMRGCVKQPMEKHLY